MNDNICGCICGNVTFTIPWRPVEIAKCYCSICRSIHGTEFVGFTKYSRNSIKLDFDKIVAYRSSKYAMRYRCCICEDWICMLYDNSDNIWIVVDRIPVPYFDAKTYDIYQRKK
jgi:hypothetical protein